MWIPLLVRAQGLKPAIFGGGAVACRKAETLCRYGVQSVMVSPQPPKTLAGCKPIPQWVSSLYQPEHLDNANLVIAATDDREVNLQICREAEARGILALNASEVNHGTVSFPNAGIVEDITLTVSTGGASPTAGALILSQLMASLEQNHWPQRIRLLKELRHLLRKHEPECSVRHDRMREYGTMSLEELQKRRNEYED